MNASFVWVRFSVLFLTKYGRDRMVVPITTNALSSNPVHGEVYAIQHCVITYLSVTWDKSVVVSGYSGFLHQ
jgi:hypothetical protein